MAVVIVYHSETGHTRSVAEYTAKRIGAVLIPVRDRANYNRVTRYLVGAPRARRGERDRIEPSAIDVNPYQGIVLGSPVWAWSPTPAINAAVAALEGCEGKEGIVFTISGGMPGETLDRMRSGLKERGVRIKGAFHFAQKDLGDTKKLGEFVQAIKAMSDASPV